MARVLFVLALIVAAASAFVVPAQNALSSPAFVRTSEMKMMPMETVVDMASSVAAQNANLIATSADDFAGYSYPVIGIACLAAVILYFSPPLSEE